LDQVKAGTMVRITSTGTKATPNGDMYTYKVEVDSDNTICVNLDSDSDAQSESSVETDEYYSDEAALEEDDNQALALAAVEARKAKVQALFNSKNKSTK